MKHRIVLTCSLIKVSDRVKDVICIQVNLRIDHVSHQHTHHISIKLLNHIACFQSASGSFIMAYLGVI